MLRLTRVRVFGLALVVFAGLAALVALRVGQTLENHSLDFCYRLRPQSPAPPELVIVAIDEQSFQDLRKAWPWPRRLHAEIIRQLKAAGAGLIVFDVIFPEPTDPEDDQLFAEAIREAGNVILATTIETTEDSHARRRILLQPFKPFREAARALGLTLVTPDSDGIVRRFQVSFRDEETLSHIVARIFLPKLAISARPLGAHQFHRPPRTHLHHLLHQSAQGPGASPDRSPPGQDSPGRPHPGGLTHSPGRLLLHALLFEYRDAHVRGGNPRTGYPHPADQELGA